MEFQWFWTHCYSWAVPCPLCYFTCLPSQKFARKRPDIDQWDCTIYSSYIWSIEQTLPELCSVMIWVHFSFPSQNCAGHFLEATGERTHYQGQCGAAAVPGLWEVGVSVCECVHVCLSVCLSVSVCTCVFVCLSVFDNVEQLQCQEWERCVCLSVCECVHVGLSVCLSVTMWSSYSARIVRGVCVYLSLCECVHVCLSVCLSVGLWQCGAAAVPGLWEVCVCLSVCECVHMCVCLYVCNEFHTPRVCVVHPAGPHLLQCRKLGEEHSTPTSCTAREGSSCSSMVCVHSCCEMTKQLG